MKNVAILGSTGSIGRNALEVISALNGYCSAYAIAAKSNWELLGEQIKTFKPKFAVLLEDDAYEKLKGKLKNSKTELLCGDDGIMKIISAGEVDVVLQAIVGAAGLPYSIHALKSKKTLALANKESMVMAGYLMKKYAKENYVEIIPIDSEHSAIFQAIRSGNREEIRRIVITGSGGPFLNYDRRKFDDIVPSQALKHPIWNMGQKITIDSATLMNKALEIIEAKWLFDVDASQIEVVIHPQSIIHSMVEFCDGSVIAQMGLPDMKTPIQYALTYPERKENSLPRLNLPGVNNLTFHKPDLQKFASIKLGYKAAQGNGTLGAVMNSANEVAVDAFLRENVKFPAITEIVEGVMNKHTSKDKPNLSEIYKADSWARKTASELIEKSYATVS